MQTKWPELVLWQVGTNDALSGEDESKFRFMMQRGIDAARRSQAQLILIDPQYSPRIKDIVQYERYVGIVGQIGAEDHVPVFSRYALMKAWGRQSRDVLSSMLAPDGLHMSDRGYGCLAWQLADEMARRWGRSPQLELVGNKTQRQPLPVVPHAADLHNAADLHAPEVAKPTGGAS